MAGAPLITQTLNDIQTEKSLFKTDRFEIMEKRETQSKCRPGFTCIESVTADLNLDREGFSRVLVIYTGGTIGMKQVNGG